MLLAMALRERGSSTRIDVVFDNYREISIKNLEREKRGAEMGATYYTALTIVYNGGNFCPTQRTNSD